MSICKYCGGTAPEGTDICRNCGMLLKIADTNIDSDISADTSKAESTAPHDPTEMLAVAETANQTDTDLKATAEQVEISEETEYSERSDIPNTEAGNRSFDKTKKNAEIPSIEAENSAEHNKNADNSGDPDVTEVHELAHLTTIDIPENESGKSDTANKSEIQSSLGGMPGTEELTTLAELSEMTKNDISASDTSEIAETSIEITPEKPDKAETSEPPASQEKRSLSEINSRTVNNTINSDNVPDCTENKVNNPAKDTDVKRDYESVTQKQFDTEIGTDIQNTDKTASEIPKILNTDEAPSYGIESDKNTSAEENSHDQTDNSSKLSPEIMEAVAAVLNQRLTEPSSIEKSADNSKKKTPDRKKEQAFKIAGDTLKRIKKPFSEIIKVTASAIRKTAAGAISIADSAAKAIHLFTERKAVRSAAAIAKKPFVLVKKAAIKTAHFFMGTKYPDGLFTESEIKNNTITACIAYFPLMFPIPSILRPKSRYLRYHSICGAAETLCMAAVIFAKRLICHILRNIFTVTVNAGSSFEHIALSHTGRYLISAAEIISYIIIFVIFISCIAMPVFGRKHSLAPNIFYKLAESVSTRDSDHESSNTDRVQNSSRDDAVDKKDKTNDAQKNKP